MAWFKVDDTFPHHAKVLMAGNAAVGLWVRAGAWAMQQLTDGFVPTHVARTIGSKAEAERLVAAGLWVETEGGYAFHQWTEVQRTKEQVKADRHAAAERQRLARERAKSRRESQRDKSVSHGPPDQTRPDQTSSSYGTTSPNGEGADEPPTARKRATQLPADWQPNDDHRAIAAERGVDVDLEATKMRDWATAEGKTGKDWDARFRNWLRSARPTTTPSTARVLDLPDARDIEKPPDGLSPAEYAAWAHAQKARRAQ